MKCPNCQGELNEFTSYGLSLARCSGCHGIWFDKDELKKVIDDRDGDLAWMHFDLWSKKEKINAIQSDKRCPTCKKKLVVLKYDDSEVEVEACLECGGLWLDSGEFTKIIEFLEKILLEKDVPDYIKEMAQEGERMVLDPKQSAVEARHFLILTKLLQYRILAENSFLAGIIAALPK